jgi:hypothetical protein
MNKSKAKQLVYRYNGVESSEEVEVDLDGEIPIPNRGDIVLRNGKNWEAVHVTTQISSDGSMPIVRIFLTDKVS